MEYAENFIEMCDLVIIKELNNAIVDEGLIIENYPHMPEKPRWNRMSQILLSGPDASLTIKLFFDIKEIVACKSFKTTDKTSQYFIDFTKELCNVIGGRIKSHIDQTDLKVELSLPFSASTFDDLFIPPPTHQNVISLNRLIKSFNAEMGAALIIEFRDEKTLDQLNRCNYHDKKDSIEFF